MCRIKGMRIITTKHFENQLNSISKKYRNASRDVLKALETFDKESAQYLGARMYKIRVRSADMNKGKSSGFRLIVLCVEVASLLVPITLYQKSNQENITESELTYHLVHIRAELDMKDI